MAGISEFVLKLIGNRFGGILQGTCGGSRQQHVLMLIVAIFAID
jgi:hypothetical protein